MHFHIIASTGRTATTFLAAALDTIEGVVACHEGYGGADKGTDPLLPLINLENSLAYQDPARASAVIAEKRSAEVIAQVGRATGAEVLIDVAYYNPTMGAAILEAHPGTRMVGIIRDCAGFVRSATQMTGEDLLPVGWPDPGKELTDRERFIGFGRIRPPRGSADWAAWKGWSAIERNIWLWRETNLLLIAARDRFPDRVTLIDFSALKNDPDRFWQTIVEQLALPKLPMVSEILTTSFANSKNTGYQIGPATEWSDREQAFLADAEAFVQERWGHVGRDNGGAGLRGC